MRLPLGISRREFLYLVGGAAAGAGGLAGGLWLNARAGRSVGSVSLDVNDIHSKLNPTRVAAIERPDSLEQLLGIVGRANREKNKLCIAGSRHAMGGQQFADGAVMVDTRGMRDVMDLDTRAGLVRVEAGVEWPDLVEQVAQRQPGVTDYWTIRCKQTGADKLTLGGAVAANAHGRTLKHPPVVADIDELLLVTASGDLVRCSRTVNPELFRLVCGGYGLFGVVHSVVYRLEKRHKLERVVEVVTSDELMPAFNRRIDEGFTLGDWQYAIDDASDEFLHRGVFSCYKPVPIDTKIAEDQKKVSDRAWQELVYLAHTDKSRAFKLYADYYLKTSGQIYWSDTSQLGGYDVDYHLGTDRRLGSKHPGTEMITEINVPRARLADFLRAAAQGLRKHKASVIYGTIRLAEKDDWSFLTWAKQSYACVIFNLHVEHTPEKIAQAADALRMLIDLAAERSGTYYLTYHRWATKSQVLSCYPQFGEFLAKKEHYDPTGLFQSEWYRHYRQMFAA
ncbi:MAG: FAD-binding oxidoreductase [Fimbriimonas ginsengisoli]|uniref:FAD-binding oxidoreductase n=1 Tax=Fimbriimonas ginsengisoli TaxID=1005039 RepID=A0A931LR54_FIMGI|nr:FAD-binding oxidoreductase [Fimbriimonas ginsengisoli]